MIWARVAVFGLLMVLVAFLFWCQHQLLLPTVNPPYDKLVHAVAYSAALLLAGWALAASNPIIAHHNKFNRWVAGDSALYFSGAADLDQHITHLIQSQSLCESLRSNAKKTVP